MVDQSSGAIVEQAARAHLQQQGLRLLASNFRCRSGEIDLIMQDDDCVVFVEVRYRKSSRFGGGAVSVNHRKQRKIIQSAKYFLLRNRQLKNIACRFDVVSATGNANQPELSWIRNAFSL
jgi:putative endonuclease